MGGKHKIMKITPYRIKKGILYLKHYGPKIFWNRLKDKMEAAKVPYAPWYERHAPGAAELRRQERLSRHLSRRPLFSIVIPAYSPDKNYFFVLLRGLQEQSYDNWQLCIADASDSEDVKEMVSNYRYVFEETRVSYLRLKENGGIAENTNAGIDMAKGDWIGFMDHDDLLAPNALYELARLINQDEEIEAIYTDEDQVESGRDGLIHQKPHFKPDFSPDLLRSNNYITHFFCVKSEVIDRAGCFRSEFDGAQDYDFILRCTEAAKKVAHIPKILYHWRIHSKSTADNPMSKTYAYQAGQRAIQAHLSRCGERGEVSELPHFGFYRVKYAVAGTPLVSILISGKSQADALRRCIESIQRSTYQNYEIILVNNNDTEQKPLPFVQELLENGKLPGGQAVTVLPWQKEFHAAAIYNLAASHARGDYFVLLNNDIEIITRGWLEEMLGNCQRPGVGVVGARLYYPNDTIQHAGMVVGMDGIATNMFQGLKRGQEGYYHKAALQLNYSAVTADCLMASRETYEKLHGMEEKLPLSFYGVDFCLRVRREGMLVVYDPFIEAYHYGAVPCGEAAPEKSGRTEKSKEERRLFETEAALMHDRWAELLQKGDPFYNPNLSLKKSNYSLKA